MPIALILEYQKSVDRHTPHLLRRSWRATGSYLQYFDEATGSHENLCIEATGRTPANSATRLGMQRSTDFWYPSREDD